MDCDDRMSLGWADSTQQNDSAKQSLQWGAASTRFTREVYDESGNNVDWSKAWSIGSYFKYTTFGDDELTLGMDEVATPHGTDKDSLYFVAVNSSDNRVGLDGSSNPYSTVLWVQSKQRIVLLLITITTACLSTYSVVSHRIRRMLVLMLRSIPRGLY